MTSRVSVVVVRGPLAGVAERFRVGLEEQGYTSLSAANQLRLLAHLSRWMLVERLDPEDLCDLELTRFLSVRRAAGYTCWLSLRGLQPLLRVLRSEGVMTCAVVAVPSMVDVLVADFAEFLTVEKGLAVSTVTGRVLVVRRFLDRVDVDGLAARDVAAYVATLSHVGAVGTVKLHLTGVRSLLRFLFVSGRVALDLSPAVLAAAGWRDSGLPKGLTDGELVRLVEVCGASRCVGYRDRALVLLLARLGLRCCEAARLRLDDIDWRAGEITVVGKGTRMERLPLPVDVGEALSDYLVHERPAGAGVREVFLRTRAPKGSLTAEAVGSVIHNAAARAGLVGVSAHRLRHTAAMGMLRHGADLVEIGQVLRHRNLVTTAIYAKVDLVRLRRLARPWPHPTLTKYDLERQERSLARPWPHQIACGEVTS